MVALRFATPTMTLVMVLLPWVMARSAHAVEVAFAPGEPRADSQFTITPARPTPATVVRFFDPFDRRLYGNDCVAEMRNGRPRLVIDPLARTIDLTLGPDRPTFCPAVVQPHSGLQGNFGRLSPGEWTYRSFETHTFTVVPEPGALAALSFAAVLLLRRRRDPGKPGK